MAALLEQMRQDTGRKPGHHLHFNKVRSHSQRLRLAQTLGAQGWLRGVCVVACKRHLPRNALNDDQVYLYQLRMLLERLSWFGRTHKEKVAYTIGHIRNFRVEKLKEYESRLRESATQIDWAWLDEGGGHVNQPQRVQELQLADVFASSVGCAFNPDEFGNVETRYLEELSGCLYRPDGKALTSYGLKMHPWNEATQQAYPWIKEL